MLRENLLLKVGCHDKTTNTSSVESWHVRVADKGISFYLDAALFYDHIMIMLFLSHVQQFSDSTVRINAPCVPVLLMHAYLRAKQTYPTENIVCCCLSVIWDGSTLKDDTVLK